MKRISFLLATLTAIALFACSNDNSNSFTEDVDYSPVKALQKAPVDITPNATGSKTIDCPGTMMISNVPYGSTVQSNEVMCDFTSIIPSNAKNTKYDFTSSIVLGSSNSIGALANYHWVLRCGAYYVDIPWSGTPITISTTAFVGDPANVKCYLSFYARCAGTGENGIGCKEMRNKVSMTNYYSY